MAHTGVTFKIPDRYEYVGPRHVGGQGYVYIYKDTFLLRNVAIKEMKHPGDAATLQDELAKIREIRSRHVLEVYDLFEAKRSGGLALVEECVPGPTLEEFVASTTLSKIQAIKILWQIACGIADIHAHRIIHRDIKPQNIRLDAEGIIKILDFGLSSIMVEDAETLASRGTQHYIAPEMYNTPPIHLSEGIDVYAFGVTVWYFLNGGVLPPPLRETPPQSQNSNISLRGARLVLPRRLTDLLDKAVHRDPGQRPTMAVIRDALHGYITSGQHRLVLYYNGKQVALSKTEPRVTLKVGTSSLTINYDLFNFFIEEVEGNVFLNNTEASVGTVMPNSFVITFGDTAEGPGRTFLPMTVLAPEVVL